MGMSQNKLFCTLTLGSDLAGKLNRTQITSLPETNTHTKLKLRTMSSLPKEGQSSLKKSASSADSDLLLFAFLGGYKLINQGCGIYVYIPITQADSRILIKT